MAGLRVRGMGDNAGHGFLAELVGDALAGQHQRRGAVADRGRGRCRDPPVLGESGAQLRIFSGLPLPGCSLTSTVNSPLRLTTVTPTISFSNLPEEIASLARLRLSIA